jgi:hypothetical protein
MTERKIISSLNTIKACKQKGYLLEGLLKSYQLNTDLIKFILSSVSPGISLEGKKIKAVINEFLEEINSNERMKTIINKRSIKSLKPWITKMDLFFKELKLGRLPNPIALQDETEKIFGILKISANKLFVKK